MSLGLRVTFNSLARGAQGGMASALTRLARAQETITTGKRIARASDDPAGAAQVMRLNDTLSEVGQFMRNGDEAKSFLALTDSSLDGVGDLVRQARTLTLQAATATNGTPDTRHSLAEQITRIKEQVVGIANATLHGRYIFAGQRAETRPFDLADPTNAYRGDSGSLRVEINRGEYVGMNISGDRVFTQLLTDLDGIKEDILAGDHGSLSQNGIADMEAALGRVLDARGRAGALVKQVEHTRSRLDLAQQEFEALLSNVRDMDISEAIVELQASQTAYQAALSSTARTFQQSLMDYLK